MRDKYFSQRHAVPKTHDADTTATQRLKGDDYSEKMKARYKQYAQREAVVKTEEADVVTPIKGDQNLRALPPLIHQTQHILEHIPVAGAAVVVGLVILFIHGYRLGTAPDIFSDEGVYLLVGTNVARGFGLVLDQGVFLWHPPAYMLIEAAYIKLAGLTNADSLTVLLSVRQMNIFFSAITGSLLVLFGRKLHSYKAGLVMAALFLMDPYVQRINRRGMLETLAMLCVLLGLYFFFTYQSHLTIRQRLGSGIAFGLALLTKEAMFFEVFALLIYVVWFRRHQVRDVAWVVITACSVYLFYPIWAIVVGQGNNYLAYKIFGISRIFAVFTGKSPVPTPRGADLLSAPKVSSLENIWILLTQYGMSYLLIALAAIFTVILIFRFRHLVAARFLISWSIFSFGFGLILGSVSDQYFYYLIVPSIIVAGYNLTSLLETAMHLSSPKKMLSKERSRPTFSQAFIEYRIMWKPIFAVFLVLFLYNSYVWMETYAIDSDNAYINIVKYIRTTLPGGETIVASDDVAFYFLSPSYNVRLDRDTKEIVDRREHYFIMSSKDAWGGFDETTPQFYNWVIRNSCPLFEQEDRSFWKIGVYQLTTTAIRQNGQCSVSHASSKGILHSSPTATPTPSVIIHRSYLGTLYDISTGLKTNISLTNIRQQQRNFSGYFGGAPKNSLFKGMPENGSFVEP